MNILLIGNGGREHALAWKIAQSPKVDKIYSTRGNAGIAKHAEIIDVAPTDIDGVVNFTKNVKIDLAVVAPDDPLVLGMVDALQSAGVRAFGPNKLAAEIEGSKVYSKNLMKKYNIPTAAYETFDNPMDAIEYIKNENKFPTVIKAEGLALGKGVIIAEDLKMSEDAINEIMVDKKFGKSGNRVVVEEFLVGREITVLAFTDGKTLEIMPSSQDHKRALDNDMGLNTGGMGAFSPSPLFDEATAKWCEENIFVPTLKALEAEGREFKGVIYFGLIKTADGIKVIEYNARFGDPETQVVLPQLKTDIIDVFEACIDGTLGDLEVEWNNVSTVGVIMASGGYPADYEKGKEILGIEEAEKAGCQVFVSGAKEEDGRLVTNGGRVLCVVATGKDLAEARANSYAGVAKISFENMHYRKDICKL